MLQRIRAKYMTLIQRFVSTSTATERSVRVVSSGIQPTGVPHLGNYLGAIKPWVELQKEPGEILYSIADLHALTTPSLDNLHDRILKLMALLLASGIDPNRCTVFRQSEVFEHSMLFWVFSCLVEQSVLGECTEWKWKSKTTDHSRNVGLFASPIMDAADILLYRSTHVPVGSDQVEVVELCQEVAKLFNQTHGDYFPIPEYLEDSVCGKIRNLRDPSIKMSKSRRSEAEKIILTDNADEIRHKIQQTITDNISSVTFDLARRPVVSNLIQIHSGVTGMTIEEICRRAQDEELDIRQYKIIVAEAVIDCLQPMQGEYERLMCDKHYLMETFMKGQRQAKEVAAKTWENVIKLTGLKM